MKSAASGSGKCKAVARNSPFNNLSVKAKKLLTPSEFRRLVNPADEATAVAIGSNLVITFSEDIQRGNGDIVLKTAAGAMVASYPAASSNNLSISGHSLTINPSVDLSYATAYMVEFAAGSINDISSNSYAGSTAYNFMTLEKPLPINGGASKDSLAGTAGNDVLDGGSDTDIVNYHQRLSAYTIAPAGTDSTAITDSTGGEGADMLIGIERLHFADVNLALDTDGNAGQVYRLYKSAFARNPDLTGLGNWIDAMDNGQSLEQVASTFAASSEFQGLYGTNASNEDFVKLLYLNALGRAPEAGAVSNWAAQIASGGITRAWLLANFSESTENKAAVQKSIENGIFYATAEQSNIASQGLNLGGTTGAESLYGSIAKDVLQGLEGDDMLNGGAGVDTAVYGGSRSGYGVIRTDTTITVSGGTEGTDTLVDIERLKFSDGGLAFDINGNAGQVYRLYQAAFDRTADVAGLSDWIRGMDGGMTLNRVASWFLRSVEFQEKYGAHPTDDAFITLLYENVLNRAPDDGGKGYWMDELGRGATREMALIGFSESAENQAAVIGVIQDGIQFIPA